MDLISPNITINYLLQIRVWWREDQLDKTDLALEMSIKSVEWFTEYTGIPYGISKMGKCYFELLQSKLGYHCVPEM